MKKILALTFIPALLMVSACAESVPDMSMSAAMNGQIESVEIKTSATVDTSKTADTGTSGTSPSGAPQPPSMPADSSPVDNEDSPSVPVTGSPKPRCVPPMQMKDALLSIFWARRNGDPAAMELASVRLSDPNAKEKLAAVELKILEYKNLLRTGWGNMELRVVLCDDKNMNDRCDKDEVSSVVFSIRAPKLWVAKVQSKHNAHGDSDSQSDDSANDSSSDDDVKECSSSELGYNLASNSGSEHSCHMRVHKKNSAPIELSLKF